MSSVRLKTYVRSMLAVSCLIACGGEPAKSAPVRGDAAVNEDSAQADEGEDEENDLGAQDKKDAGASTSKTDAGRQPTIEPKADAAAPSTPPSSVSDAGSTPAAPLGPVGPEDGDPAKPVVTVTEVPCRDPSRGAAFGRSNFMFEGRDMIVDYPCNKREGAPVTFILNLHGTTPVEQHFYQWGYFSAWKHVATHNLVIVTPSSVVTQWGNGDMGVDEPYLLKTVDWVYATFGTKFDIRAMWVGGHSWGSAYTARFGCLEAIKDKVKGLILMSGARPPACASRVSILNSAANLGADGSVKPEGLLNQMANATAHGCDAQMMRALDMNNDETFWPGCDPGWAHANYLMKTKQHATSMDPSVVKSMVDYIKQTRQ